MLAEQVKSIPLGMDLSQVVDFNALTQQLNAKLEASKHVAMETAEEELRSKIKPEMTRHEIERLQSELKVWFGQCWCHGSHSVLHALACPLTNTWAGGWGQQAEMENTRREQDHLQKATEEYEGQQQKMISLSSAIEQAKQGTHQPSARQPSAPPVCPCVQRWTGWGVMPRISVGWHW